MASAASYNQTSYPSAPTSHHAPWDVFLSFRGIDTRYTFTDHLYTALHRTGIRTFRDNPDLHSGEVISRALPQAIQESRTYIVVFSENYASSRWCLEELVEILNCYKTMKRSIIPVFYNISPSVVRHQTERFREAFEKHGIGFPIEKVNKWRHTLTEVADFSGHDVPENRSEAQIIDEIVDRILYEINPKTLAVPKYPVGLDSPVKIITTLLSSNTEGITRIGIYGMGGVGKTTLAKAVYNHNYHRFQGSCFLANVREVSRKEKGIVRLQQKLVNDVLKCRSIKIDNVDQGIELIRARICSTRVLIVIDDLDDLKALEHLEGPFSLASTLIITTRNDDLLDAIGVEARYKVKELTDAESRQLFSHHAFGHDNISDTFMELSQEILERAGGLPLALKVFGSNLFNKSKEGWRWFIDKLKRVPSNDVEKILLISFKALEIDYLQDIFLDIACFFIGQEEEEIFKIMETCYTLVNYNIDILKKRSLLTTNDNNKLAMHHLLQDMAKKIVCNSFPNEPGKHSRLWVPKDICDVLKNNKGTEAIEGIIPQSLNCQDILEGVSYTTETFKMMRKLRFLYLENVNLTGNFRHTFKVLRMLRWKCCPLEYLPFEFYPQELVILELPQSKMTTMWELNMVSHVFKKLRTLNVSNSLYLTVTPDFTNFECLETLNFEGCVSLKVVHISIGSLMKLVFLNLRGCVNLKSLPDTICNLKVLKGLCIANCSGLESLPTELGNIESLKELNMKGLVVPKLPDSMRRLSELVELKLSFNEDIESLPDIVSNLRSLKYLDISRCKIMWKIKRSRDLVSNGANPDLLSIAELPPSLKWIKANGCISMERLPNLSNLKHLEILELTNCSGLNKIQGLKDLTSIRRLHFGGCNSSLLASTLTERFFQIYSEFGHQIEIYIGKAGFPYWISQSSNLGSLVSLDLRPTVSHNYLAMILCLTNWEEIKSYRNNCSIKTTTSDFTWIDDTHYTPDYRESWMIIVPKSILFVRDYDDRFDLTAYQGLQRIHVLYKTDITMIDEYDRSHVSVEDEKNYSSKRLKHFQTHNN